MPASLIFSQNAWINELHYDNAGGDVDEMVEVVIENASTYNLSDFAVYLYNGNDGSHYPPVETLNTFTVGSTIGNFTIFYKIYAANGIQNGAPDGLALTYQGVVVPGQWLSYEGTMIATTGPAAGTTSVDILVSEGSTTTIGQSLQLSGTGTQYSQFTWQQPQANTAGLINTGQSFGSFTPDPEPSNYPTAFTAIPSGLSVTLSWTDATGTQLPAAYLVLAGTSPVFTIPVDSVPVPDDPDLTDGNGAKNVFFGQQTCTFSGLSGSTPYYFMIFSYTNSGQNINFKTGGTPPSASAITASVIEAVDFNDITFGNWDTISLASDKNWYIDFFAPDTFAKISGHQGNVPSDDWLVSPPLYLDNYLGEVLSFRTAKNYTGPDLEVKISSNYSGGDPSLATWTSLSPALSTGSWIWTPSGNVDLSTYSGTVYIAFHYTSTATESATWELDDVVISGNPVQSGQPVINEFLADNDMAYIDTSDNNYDDWIELFNPTASAISLHNWYLTDDITDTTKWQFPDTSMPAGSYLIVWADGDVSDPGLHADFSISKNGEEIYLFDPSKTLIDSVVFGPQKTDTTWARIPNAFGPYTFAKPTPMAFNQLFPVIVVDTVPPVVVNAWATSDSEVKVRFNEAVNATAEVTSNYGGVGAIVTALRSSTLDTVTLTLATPLASGVPYMLNISGIEDTAGNVMASAQTFPVSWGTATVDLVITEIMYNPPETNIDTMEYIEVYNNGNNPVIMTGIQFTEGIDFTFPAMILNAGDYVLVARSSSAIQGMFGKTALQWASGDGLSNSGEMIRLEDGNGNILDEVEYSDMAPWPTQPDGTGPSLVFCDPTLDNNNGANWTYSIEFAGVNGNGDTLYGTPGGPCMGSGVDDHGHALEGIRVYPNPADGYLILEVPSGEDLVMHIYDVLGAEKFSHPLVKGTNRIDLPGSMNGQCFLVVRDRKKPEVSATRVILIR